jgi:hypothetical protein
LSQDISLIEFLLQAACNFGAEGWRRKTGCMYNPYGPVAIKSNSLKQMTYKVQDVIIVCVCASEGAKAKGGRPWFFAIGFFKVLI